MINFILNKSHSHRMSWMRGIKCPFPWQKCMTMKAFRHEILCWDLLPTCRLLTRLSAFANQSPRGLCKWCTRESLLYDNRKGKDKKKLHDIAGLTSTFSFLRDGVWVYNSDWWLKKQFKFLLLPGGSPCWCCRLSHWQYRETSFVSSIAARLTF